MTKTALVLGVTGGIGGAVAQRMIRSGWHVKALMRSSSAMVNPVVERVAGDAMDAGAVAKAAQGADVIVHAVNPPGYRDWGSLVLPMIDNSIAAAKSAGARVLLPGTVYNYGPDSFPLIREDALQNPSTRKGRIRVELERRLQAVAERSEAKVLIVRAGDYFGPGAANNWFGQGLITAGRRPKVVRQPGKAGIAHQWAYLPDVAEAMVQLLERPSLPAFARFHMQGHWDHDGRQMVEAIVRALGDPTVPIRLLPWPLLRLAALFSTTPREMMEMRYLWQHPIRLVNDRLKSELGEEPHTPLAEAVQATLIDLGCLPS